MSNSKDIKIAEEILRIRLSQILINELNKNGDFKCPVHLALGHESIAIAVSSVMQEDDWLLVPHRNIHYSLARTNSLKAKLDEYLLKDTGEAGGKLGCMNLYNESAGILYASSILGNQLCVSTGVALGNKVKNANGLAIVITGDGGMEEGSFYESLVFMKTCSTPAMVIVENNGWSLGTQIHERRCSIDLKKYADSLDISYDHLSGNDPYQYIESLQGIRKKALKDCSPCVVEVDLKTLGDWSMETDEFPEGKFINYHSGVAPNVEVREWPVIEESEYDPVFAIKKHFEASFLAELSSKLLTKLKEEIQ